MRAGIALPGSPGPAPAFHAHIQPSMNARPFKALVLGLVFLTGCAASPRTPHGGRAALTHEGTEERAVRDLQAASSSARDLDKPGDVGLEARQAYNTAAADLTALLRSADGGRLWNHPLELRSRTGVFRLRFQSGGRRRDLWSPDKFTAFRPANEIQTRRFRRRATRDGVGGTLVGIRAPQGPREAAFAPEQGSTAPVTATLAFRGADVTLALRDPRRQIERISLNGRPEPLAVDFSAPLASQQPPRAFLPDLAGVLFPGRVAGRAGLVLSV